LCCSGREAIIADSAEKNSAAETFKQQLVHAEGVLALIHSLILLKLYSTRSGMTNESRAASLARSDNN